MRFIHTADWHLGRTFYNARLTDDQAHVLDQLVSLAKDAKPDVVIISGDVYDRAVPPVEAVELLDETLSRLVLDLKVPVLMIAGNHDSPERMDFGARLLRSQSLYVFGDMGQEVSCVKMSDEHGPVVFWPVPYLSPAQARQHFAEPTITDHQAAMQACVARTRPLRGPGVRSVFVGHAFVSGGQPCESERPLSLGGAEMISADCLSDFSYSALGHLHRRQSPDGGSVHYPGSLLKYSFDEVGSQKSVNLVEMDGVGRCRVEYVSFTPRRDVRRVSGRLMDILTGPTNGESRDDYILVSLLDEGAILDVMGRLREVYPNTLHVERPGLFAGNPAPLAGKARRAMTADALFASFFDQIAGRKLKKREVAALAAVIESIETQEREGSE